MEIDVSVAELFSVFGGSDSITFSIG